MFEPAHVQHAPLLRRRAAWPTPTHAVLKLSCATPFICRCLPQPKTPARCIPVGFIMKTYQSVVKSIGPKTLRGITERDKCKILSKKPKSLWLLGSVKYPSAVLPLRVTPGAPAVLSARGGVQYQPGPSSRLTPLTLWPAFAGRLSAACKFCDPLCRSCAAGRIFFVLSAWLCHCRRNQI